MHTYSYSSALSILSAKVIWLDGPVCTGMSYRKYRFDSYIDSLKTYTPGNFSVSIQLPPAAVDVEMYPCNNASIYVIESLLEAQLPLQVI
jgi:hypothetical protein